MKDPKQMSLLDLADVVEISEVPKDETLRKIRDDAVACSACSCHKNRSNPHAVVFADGSPDARLMLVSEAPGANEDIEGIPFVGAAGKKLNEILAWVGLNRQKDVYICNVLKCWPGRGNPTPLPKQSTSCKPFLERQIDAVRPKVIVAVGNIAFGVLVGQKGATMKNIHGRTFQYKGIPVIPTYHPAALLHARSRDIELGKVLQKSMAEDWMVIKKALENLG